MICRRKVKEFAGCSRRKRLRQACRRIVRYFLGKAFVVRDCKGTEARNRYEKEFAEAGCAVVCLDDTDGISSSILRDKMNLHAAE